jgi:tetrahydromethanopterin S-methyltransferase subunit E
MTKIVGMDEIKSGLHLQQEIASGGQFVVYQYCISVLIMTFRRSSDIYFISASESRVLKGLGFSLLSFFLGWWGIPWGPIYTIQALWINFNGGKDVTQEVLASMAKAANKA